MDFSTTNPAGNTATMIGTDMAVCQDCLAEMCDPDNRRWRYAFISCARCGPRYTITYRLPYARQQTGMAAFPLCPVCQSEYGNPANRWFHTESLACPDCGPSVRLTDRHGKPATVVTDNDPVAATLALLQGGEIVAIKGLGGFHLACDAHNTAAVLRLREAKQRDAKPFAIMVANSASLAHVAEIGTAEKALLESVERPIVLLRKKPEADVAFPGIAPGLAWLGVMLPYTPLQWLLFHQAAGQPAGTSWMQQSQPLSLVMTSANPHGEPLVTGNTEAVARLSGIAGAILMHDRDIAVRCDDSVMRVADTGIPRFIRRARGYTPRAIRLPHAGPPVLATGGYLKNTLCITRGDEAFVSQYIGSLNNPATCTMLADLTRHLLDILQVRPERIAHDLHPDFFSTRYAMEMAETLAVPVTGVQHHHAHLVAIAAEHGITRPFLGLAMDGTGYGSDGTSWGGELLGIQGATFQRHGHLAPLPLPGGDKAAREPWRMAAAVLHLLDRGDEIVRRFPGQPAAAQLHVILKQQTHCPSSVSLGRWFDAAAGLLGVSEVMTYEGQAAMLLEGLAAQHGAVAPMHAGYHLHGNGVLDLLPLLARLAGEQSAGAGAALFHATLAAALADWVQQVARQQNSDIIALGGGCFLNHILARQLTRLLTEQGFTVLTAHQLPPDDAGLSLGQAWVAIQQSLTGDS